MTTTSIRVTLPDGSVREYPRGTTVRGVAESIGKRLGRDAIGGMIDGGTSILDVHTPIDRDVKLKIVTVNSAEGLDVVRHSTAHLMARAVQRLFPGTQVTIGPSIENGFYYDFARDGGFTPDELEKIEGEMQRLAALDEPFRREVVTREQAKAKFASMGEKYKLEIIDGIPEGEEISLYHLGDWVDVCRGPHVPASGYLKAFKLTHTAGAYWRGDERNPMLARVYGTAFWDKAALDTHLNQVEEAKKRDHRKLGKDLGLFFFHPIAPAMPFFTGKGAVVYNELIRFVRGYYALLGFEEVITPQVVDVDLFKTSGHYANYKDNMYFSQFEEREYGMKPMNCPGHTLIYAHEKRSYRELPYRIADFGRLHRYERSGVTGGLTRVRSFAQDDAHIFCREDQIGAEIAMQLAMIRDVYAKFELEMKVGLSTRPEQSIGREPELSQAERAEWDRLWAGAEDRLRQAIQANDVPFELNPGDGAFYGPKLDFQVKDAIGRWFQLGTIQLDFAMPRRFGLAYTNESSGESTPVMIHRAVLGSLERFFGILLEHTAGDLPVWLAPTQVRLLPVHEDLLGYGQRVQAALRAAGVRVVLDERNEKLGFKIRDAELHKVPVVMVLGKKEEEAGAVSVRWRKKGDLGVMPLDRAIGVVLEAAAVPGPGEALVERVRAGALQRPSH